MVAQLRLQSVEKVFFGRLAEVEKAPKRSKTSSSAYRRYGRARFAHEVKMSCKAAFREVGAALYEMPNIHGITQTVMII